jgi:gliding motility-associated-like protein
MMVVSWTPYRSVPLNVLGYRVDISLNGGTFQSAGETTAADTSFQIKNFVTGQQYCIIVSAILEGGFESKSNKSCIITEMERPPGWINGDYGTVKDGKIELSFTADPETELVRYRLDRRKVTETQFTEIANLLSDDGAIVYTDNATDPEEIYVYRLGAVNNCGITVTYSNNATNIVTTVTRDANSILLKWNSYPWWLGGVSDYRILVNTGKGFSELAVLPPSDTTYTLDYSDVMYQASAGEICFIVEARENTNIHGIAGKSASEQVCTEVTEIVSLPNAFTPNGDLINDLFVPVFSFTPQEYNLIITDIRNKRLFESGSYTEAWDGTSKGVPQPQGVYLYYLSVTAPSGKIIKKSGTITILDN